VHTNKQTTSWFDCDFRWCGNFQLFLLNFPPQFYVNYVFTTHAGKVLSKVESSEVIFLFHFFLAFSRTHGISGGFSSETVDFSGWSSLELDDTDWLFDRDDAAAAGSIEQVREDWTGIHNPSSVPIRFNWSGSRFHPNSLSTLRSPSPENK